MPAPEGYKTPEERLAKFDETFGTNLTDAHEGIKSAVDEKITEFDQADGQGKAEMTAEATGYVMVMVVDAVYGSKCTSKLSKAAKMSKLGSAARASKVGQSIAKLTNKAETLAELLKTAAKNKAKTLWNKLPKTRKGIVKVAKQRRWQKQKWTAKGSRGTKQTYEVYQRNDIDWNKVRTAGDRRYIGKTNLEAAKNGIAPQLSDGNFATLHHLGQDSRGPLVEASTRYHGIGKPGQDILHSQYGRNKPNPNYPIDRKAFASDIKEYWRDRANNINK